jgi:ABC-type branched-subunit amino acid transport system ATPase component
MTMTDTTPEVVLQAEDIVMRFGGLTALDSVDVVVPERSLIGLVGPNGAGKSTLFGVCSGLLRPTRGKVTLMGKEVTGASAQSRARLGLARTFQQPEMFRGLTVREHLTLGYRVHNDRSRLWEDMFTGAGFRRTPAAETERINYVLDLLSITAISDTLVDNLPLGTSRLVEVGRALAGQPKIVLLDEPLSGLDANEAKHLARALRRTVEEDGTSLLLVEHDVPMVLSLCSNIFVLDFGRLIAQGNPDAIREDAAVKAAYLGDEPIETVELASQGLPTVPEEADAPSQS